MDLLIQVPVLMTIKQNLALLNEKRCPKIEIQTQKAQALTYLHHALNNLHLVPPFAQAGTYLPQSYLVREEMMVTERLEHVDQLGYFINNLCKGKDTYKLQRRDRILGKHVRLSFRFKHTEI